MNREYFKVLSSTAAAMLLTIVVHAAPANELTPLEKESGWELLFDGRTSAGWRSFKTNTFPEKGWAIEEGWLHCVAGRHGGDIISMRTFGDFELDWDWRLPAKANNGVKYFVSETRDKVLGHEYQMLDDTTESRAKKQTAAFYDVLGPKAHAPVRLAPEINHSKILVRGDHVEHWLNGEKVLEYECGSEPLKAAIAESKFRAIPGFGNKISGHILLTEHGNDAWFQNIKIRSGR